MLKITASASDLEKGKTLDNAYNVKVTREINGAHMLEFSYPADDKADIICENSIVVCEGQAYRITNVVTRRGEKNIVEAKCNHVYNADAPVVHIQNIPDMIGVSPYEVLQKAFSETPFTLLGDSELKKRGMRRVDYDGFLIDFFSTDKTNPYDVMQAVIENCGKGEIYTDNYNVALVERIGSDTGIRLDLTKNMKNISVERDITDMVTRLYPYGKDDAHIGSVNGSVQYIQSANADIYGVREGYRDYCEYTESDKILNRALWEFDSANEERIDVPCVNITGAYVDISKLADFVDEKINLGDRVIVIDNGNEIPERVIRLEYYPYQSDDTVISIGRVKKDLFFYLEQMGTLTRRYKKVSTSSGKVKAQAVSGVISSSGIKLTSERGNISIVPDMLTVSSGNIVKAQLGFNDGEFICRIKDNSGNTAIQTVSDGRMYFTGDLSAEKIQLGDNVLSVDSSGALCINGKVILTQE